MARLNRRGFMLGTSVAAAAAASSPVLARQAGLRATALRTENLVTPLGLEVATPRLSWRIEGAGRDVAQSAYRITASSSQAGAANGAADLWDSGKVASDQCFEIAYGGPAPKSADRIWWRVQVWDQADAASEPSAISWFEMGLLQPADWKADWINIEMADEKADREAGVTWIWGADPLDTRHQKFRFTLTLDAEPESTEFLLSAKDHLLGVWVNGVAAPMRESQYPFWGTLTPVPARLTAGRNVICVEASADTEGFFPVDGGAIAALIRVKDRAGRVTRFASNVNWRTSNTETAPNWTEVAFDDRAWPKAQASGAHTHNDPRPAQAAIQARKTFTVARPVAQARLYSTSLGAYRAYLNGKRVGDSHLAPEISVFSENLYYQAYDVTELVTSGDNVLAALVGDGWYASAFGWRMERYGFAPAPRRLLAQLVIDYADGQRQIVGTSGDWKTSVSSILSSEIYEGETMDARLSDVGWKSTGFDDAAWTTAEVGQAPPAKLIAQVAPPVREVMTLPPRQISQPVPGVHVYDFGQNFSGWGRLKVKGPAGARIQMKFAEVLKPSGEVDMANLRLANQTDVYILKGDPAGETFEPHFTYHGFRYIEMSGYPGAPGADALMGVVAHSDCAPSGLFQTDNPLVQKIWTNALWSQRSNFFAIPTDCPQRDERMGWMGDIQVFLDAAAFNMDVDAFIRRFLEDIRATQGKDGEYPIVTPQPLSFPLIVTAGWSEAGVILPWTLWRRYGDTRVIEDNWSAMERWMAWVGDPNPDFIWRNRRGLDLGDWLSVDAIKPDDETTPRVLAATAYWAYCARLLGDMARATGKTADAARYDRLLSNITTAFAREFVKADGTVGNGSQTSYVLAIHFGLVPQTLRAAAAANLAADIRRRGTRLSTGFLGTPYLLDVLADNGQLETAFGLLLQTQYPSWGYMVDKGATTMWERWNGDTGDLAMNSYNHYAFGAVVGFMYRRLGGIAAAEPGFRQIEVRPLYDRRVGRVKASYDSCLGPITTEIDGGAAGLTSLKLTVPPNAKARVHLPRPDAGWREGRNPIADGQGLRIVERAEAGLVVEVGSGDYVFSV